ncbi:hypothetical protein PFISCL1PPCAC_1793, partial [Pristionchus fissidentatus]
LLQVILSPIVDKRLGGVGTKKTRLIEDWQSILDTFLAECNSTLSQPGLIEQLKEEKFDVAFTEPTLDFCGPGLFYLLGIDKWAVVNSLAIVDGDFFYTQTPSNPSYIPSCAAMFGGQMGEQMTFIERISNLITFIVSSRYFQPHLAKYTELMRRIDPEMPETE